MGPHQILNIDRTALYEWIVQSTDDAIISKDLDGYILSWNKAAEKILGYSELEMLQQNISIIIPNYLLEEEKRINEKLFVNHSVNNYETKRIKKDGSIIDVSITFSTIKDLNGNIIGTSKILMDITEKLKLAKELEESEIKYRSLFQSNPLPMFLLEIPSMQFLDVNDSALSHYGYSKEEFLGMTAFEIRPTADKEKFSKVPNPEAGQTLKVGVWEHIKKDGSIIKVEITTHNLIFNGKKARLVLCNDITEKLIAEENIKTLNQSVADNELKFRAIIENNKDIIILMNEKFEVTYRSPSAILITGYTQEEIEQKTKSEGVVNQIHPDDQLQVIAAIQQVKVSPNIPIPVNFRSQHKNGHYLWLSGSITNFLENPILKSIVQNYQDVTEKKSIELSLQRSEKIYKYIASNIPGTVICLFDLEYRYTLIEGDLLEKLGYDKEKLLGKTIFEILETKRLDEVLPLFQKVYAGNSFSIEDDRGTYQTISRYVPLKDEGVIYGAMVVVFDVSELKKTQHELFSLNQQLEYKIDERTAQLSAAIKELEAFSYSVSHDLRAPLRGIDGWSLALLEDYGAQLDAKAHEYLGRVRSETQRMSVLIDDLLKLSKISKTELNLSKVDLTQLTKKICKRLEEEYAGRVFEFKISEGLEVEADQDLLEIMLTNLLGNACKFTGKKEKAIIEVGVVKDGNNNVFFIKDNGAGFSVQNANKLFGAFQRMHRQSDFPGSGIGLAIVQRIINLHQGSIWADSMVGEGSTFSFIINKH